MKLVFATHNQNKLKEVQALMPGNVEVVSLQAIGCHEEIPETGQTLEENARIKAFHVAHTYGYSCFADDTGLLVNALNGAPGVFSARYAGPHKDASANMTKLLTQLENETDRRAQFETVIALILNDVTHSFKGSVPGTITKAPRGKEGFGYDPVFVPDGYNQTFAELPFHIKNTISHRALAIEKLTHFLLALKPS